MYFDNVYYTDASCKPDQTLKRLDELGLFNIIPMECMGLLTVSLSRIAIVAAINYKTLKVQEIVNLIDIKELFIQTAPKVLSLKDLNIMSIPVRDAQHFRVFFICANCDRYDNVPIETMNVIMKLLCENAYLKNEVIHEENYLENVLDSSDSIVISTNLIGEIATANRMAFKFFRKKDIIGKNVSTVLRYDISDAITRVISTNKSINLRDTIITCNRGRKYIINITLSPLQNSKKKVVGVVILATDVTAKKILESQIEQLKQFAALGEVAAEVAHDIKNPLMSIRGCSRILQKELSSQPNCNKFLEPIIQEVDRINDVVDQMISYGYVMQETVYTLVSINEILEKSLNIIRFHTGSRNITIKKEFHIELPLLRGNNVKLQQAFINILMNAVQAIKNDGVITIQSYFTEDRNGICVLISDDGIGIEPKAIKKVFRPFYTTKQPTRGLGLSIVDKVIKEHKGKISIHSVLHKGTTINVFLPCSKD